MASRVSSSITIGRPIEDVFVALTNVENTEKWFPAKVKEWWTSQPPHGVGSARHAVVTMGWFRSENDAVATVFESPRRAVMKGTSKNAPFEATLSFAPVEGGTRVEATTEMFLHGPAKLFGPLFRRWYGGNWDRGLVRLKAMMESGELQPIELWAAVSGWFMWAARDPSGRRGWTSVGAGTCELP